MRAGRMEIVVPDDQLSLAIGRRVKCPFGITIIWLVYRYSDRGRGSERRQRNSKPVPRALLMR